MSRRHLCLVVFLLAVGTAALVWYLNSRDAMAVKARDDPPDIAAEPLPAARPDALGDMMPPGASARLGSTRLHPVEQIEHLALLPDNKSLVSLAREGLLSYWDARTGQLIRRFDENFRGDGCLAITPNGKTLAVTGGTAGTVRLWETATGRVLREIEVGDRHGACIYALATTLDGNQLITAGFRQPIRFWDMSTGRQVRSIGQNDSIADLATSPDGKTLAARLGDLSSGGDVRLLDIDSGREIRRLAIPSGGQFPTVQFSPDGRRLATADFAGTARIWDVASGQEVMRMPAGPNAVFSPDGHAIATGGGSIDITDLATGRRLRRFPAALAYGLGMAFSPDGRTLAACAQHIRLWDIPKGTAAVSLPGHHWDILSLAISPDGKLLASGGHDCRLLLWELPGGRCLGKLDLMQPNAVRPYEPLRFSPDGRTLLVVTHSEHFDWSLATGKKTGSFRHEDGARCVRNADGSRWAVWEPGRSRMVEIRDPDGNTVHKLEVFHERETQIRDCAFSADGSKLAIAASMSYSEGPGHHRGMAMVQFWGTATGRQLSAMEVPTIGEAFSFSADGRLTVNGGSGDLPVTVWDLENRRRLCELQSSKAKFSSSAFSPDGKLLALGTKNGYLALYSTANGRLLRRWDAHDGSVNALLFSPDGRTLFSGGHDSTILLWKVSVLLPKDAQELLPPAIEKPAVAPAPFKPAGLKTPADEDNGIPANSDREICALRWHDREVTAVAFSPEGKTLLTGGDDGLLRLYDADAGRLLRTMDAGRRGTGAGGPWDEAYYEPQGVLSAAFSPDGSLIASGSADGHIRLWDSKTGEKVRTLQDHRLKVASVDFAPDGRLFVSTDVAGGVCIWNVRSGELLSSFRPYEQRATTAVFSGDGKTLYTGGVELVGPTMKYRVETEEIRAWDVASMRELPKPKGKAMRLMRSPDGKTLAAARVSFAAKALGPQFDRVDSGGMSGTVTLTIGDAETDRPRLTLEGEGGLVALSSDGQIATAAGSLNLVDRLRDTRRHLSGTLMNVPVVIRDPTTGKPLLTLPQPGATAVAFSPDGKRLVTGGVQGDVRVWDITEKREELARFNHEREHPSAAQLTQLWDSLAGPDAAEALRATWAMAAAKDTAMAFLDTRIQPPEKLPPQRIPQLIADLDSKVFKTREQAVRELEALGPRAMAAVRKALGDKPPLEAQRRLEELLPKLYAPPDATALRSLRVIEALEHIATADGRRLIERFVSDESSHESVAAKAALQRLDRPRPRP